MQIAIITAGGAGMFCGSCMHDNTWARALQDAGVDVRLVPTYTPIRVDEQDVSDSSVYIGGTGVYRWPTFNVADSDCTNCSYTAAKSESETVISLGIAF